MNTRSIFFTVFFVIFVSLCNNIFPQTFGKIFTKDEANKLFGEVLITKPLPVELLRDLISRTEGYIMFRIEDEKMTVLDDERNILYPDGIMVNPEEVFTVYKTEVVNELLNGNNTNEVEVQQRTEVLTITAGDNTLEMGAICPPFCRDKQLWVSKK
jgi:Trp operon repressor